MTVENTINSMCKSSRAYGMPKSKWLNVENHLTVILRESGSSFTLNYLKELKEYHISRLTGEDAMAPSWHKRNAKGEPSGWQKNLHFKKAKTSIQVIGAMVNAIEFEELQPHQRDKWLKSVRNPDHVTVTSSTRFFSRPVAVKHTMSRQESNRLAQWEISNKLKDIVGDPGPRPSVPERDILRGDDAKRYWDRDLAKRIADQSVFSPSDVTGTSVPMFESSLRIPTRKLKSGKLEKSLDVTLQAYVASVNFAPPLAGVLELNRIALIEEHYPDLEIKDKEKRLELARSIASNVDLNLFTPMDELPPYQTPRLAGLQRMGQIALLQQPGGKLRAIANPNRYLQHLMRPLQGALSEVNKFKPVSVLNQDEGIAWAQSKLRDKVTLYSFDLSAATDTLHAKDFLLNSVPSMGPVFEREIDGFLDASESLWYSPDLGDDINWDKGQPLGLAPSFSVLTLMNYTAGAIACHKSGIKPNQFADHFRVVGDDFVCTDVIAESYVDAITGMGGVTNLEKSMVSNTHAEFCSQIITPQGSWPLKPKIRGTHDSIVIDSEKAPLSNVDASMRRKSSYRRTAEFLSQYSATDLANLPNIISSDQKSIVERLGAALHLQSVSLSKPSGPTETHSLAVGPAVSAVLEAVASDPESSDILKNVLSQQGHLSETILDPSFRSDIDLTVKAYDHRLDDYTPVLDLMRSASHLEMSLREIETNSVLSEDKSAILIITTDDNDGSSVCTLLDLKAKTLVIEGDTPEVSEVLSVNLEEFLAQGKLPDNLLVSVEPTIAHLREQQRDLEL